jgi:hypothetical protein
MAADVRYFGIRHHGPGSARRLVEALDELRPAAVLIEGPADASDLLPMLNDAAMQPPVALLMYAADDPSRASFWPFATYSPEYQAARWAAVAGAILRFIDLPSAWGLAPQEDASTTDASPGPTPDEAAEAGASDKPTLARDPIGALAAAGGYEDGESWWRDVIEENPEPGPIFAAIADAMAALREAAAPAEGREAAREARMRLEIAKAAKETEGAIAVVCGAWHVPALQARVAATADRALLKGAPKLKVAATWAPWTSPRLAFSSGYGAGVAAPGWCQHLWDTPRHAAATRWLARVAQALRAQDRLVSTASLIEAERLAMALAALRGRPAPGFEELRDAAIACLCFGEPVIWHTISHDLLIGAEVGGIPDNVPLAPLLEDLQREQKRVRLKPEALERELSLDLRSESGLDRSTLLHRLNLLGAPWGSLADAGRSRGTFRERWVLRWEPEYAVALVENLVYGPTIAQAAAGRVNASYAEAADLKALAERVFQSLTAQLPSAVETGIALIEKRAGQTSDCVELLSSLPALADAVRYGQAREIDAAQLAALVKRILIEGALTLPYAVRNLDAAAASAMRATIIAANSATALIDLSDDEHASWRSALKTIVEDARAAPLVAGVAARLLYAADDLSAEEAALLLSRALSPGRAVLDAAGFFEGFLDGAGETLIHDLPLRQAVDAWVQSLDGETFTAHLPLFRRAFSSLDRMQRRRLLDALFGGQAAGPGGRTLAPNAAEIWPAHFERIVGILTARPADE